MRRLIETDIYDQKVHINKSIHGETKTYAYFLKTNDVHVTTAAKFLGHSDPMITLKIYTLVRDTEVDEVVDKLRLVLG